MPNKKVLEDHYAAHPERWNRCPVCYFTARATFPVMSHEELFKHVLTHTTKSPNNEVVKIFSAIF